MVGIIAENFLEAGHLASAERILVYEESLIFDEAKCW